MSSIPYATPAPFIKRKWKLSGKWRVGGSNQEPWVRALPFLQQLNRFTGTWHFRYYLFSIQHILLSLL